MNYQNARLYVVYKNCRFQIEDFFPDCPRWICSFIKPNTQRTTWVRASKMMNRYDKQWKHRSNVRWQELNTYVPLDYISLVIWHLIFVFICLSLSFVSCWSLSFILIACSILCSLLHTSFCFCVFGCNMRCHASFFEQSVIASSPEKC